MKIIHDNRFSSVQVEVHFIAPLDENVTYRNMVKDLLIDSTQKYPTKQKMRLALDHLYGAVLRVGATTIGNQHDIVFSGNVLSNRNAMFEENIVQQFLDFLKEVLYHPNDFALNLEEIKEKNLMRIERSKEDVANFSMKEALRLASSDTALAIDPLGEIEKIKNCTVEEIVATYKKMIAEDVIKVYIAGEVKDVSFIEERNKPFNCAYCIKQNAHASTEKLNSDQSFVNIVLQTNTLLSKENYFKLVVANEILGGMDSLLFRNIREKMSLCYQIFSQCFHFDSVILIHAGVKQSQIQHCRQEILKQLDDLKQGNFDDQYLVNAKLGIIDVLKGMNDSLVRKISNEFYNEIRNMPYTIEEKIKLVDAITKQDILAIASQFEVLFTYIIEGETNETTCI